MGVGLAWGNSPVTKVKECVTIHSVTESDVIKACFITDIVEKKQSMVNLS